MEAKYKAMMNGPINILPAEIDQKIQIIGWLEFGGLHGTFFYISLHRKERKADTNG